MEKEGKEEEREGQEEESETILDCWRHKSLRHKIMSKSISYSDVLEENTGKRNQRESISSFLVPFSFFFFWFHRFVLLALALLTRCDESLSLVHSLSLPRKGINTK